MSSPDTQPPFSDGPLPVTCPVCETRLLARDGEGVCPTCTETVPVVDSVWQFPVDAAGAFGFFDLLSPIYETPLWFPLVYRALTVSYRPPDDRRLVTTLLTGEPDRDADDLGTVLDLACGTGRFTRHVAGRAATVWGIDLSDGMLRRATRSTQRRNIENVAFARMDAGELQCARSSFDRVSCCWALHVLPDVPAVLAEIHRVLSAEGRFAGVTLCRDGPSLPPVRSPVRALGGRVFDRAQLKALLSEAGFGATAFERHGNALFFGATA